MAIRRSFSNSILFFTPLFTKNNYWFWLIGPTFIVSNILIVFNLIRVIWNQVAFPITITCRFREFTCSQRYIVDINNLVFTRWFNKIIFVLWIRAFWYNMSWRPVFLLIQFYFIQAIVVSYLFPDLCFVFFFPRLSAHWPIFCYIS